MADKSSEVRKTDIGVELHDYSDLIVNREPEDHDPGGIPLPPEAGLLSVRRKWVVSGVAALVLFGAAGMAAYLLHRPAAQQVAVVVPPPQPAPVVVPVATPPPAPTVPKILVSVDCTLIRQSLAQQPALTQQFEAEWTAVRAMDVYLTIGGGDSKARAVAIEELSRATCYGPAAVEELIRIIVSSDDAGDPNRQRVVEELRAAK